MRTRVKICGFTHPSDLLSAQEAGTDAVGFVLYAKSKRAVDLDQLRELGKNLLPFVRPVLLFVNPERKLVEEALEIIPDALLQFHGSESAEFCRSFKRPWIKAVAIRDENSLSKGFSEYLGAQALLCDTPATSWGGTGKAFDWSLLDPAYRDRLILAGGLNPQNVGSAVKAVRPYAVDVSSGVESAPGRKDRLKIEEFLKAVRDAEAACFQ